MSCVLSRLLALLLSSLVWCFALEVVAKTPDSSITAIQGIRVGHVTYRQDNPVVIRTGVTAIVPDIKMISKGKGTLATHGLYAGVFAGGGNGTLLGLSFIQDFGLLSGPIILTNTEALGTAYSAVRTYMRQNFNEPWQTGIPLIGECWDGQFNTIAQTPITQVDVIQAIQTASTTSVKEGAVGAGTGMRAFGLHAGIGSSVKHVTLRGQTYQVAVLLNMNHSRFEEMLPQFRYDLNQRMGDVELFYQVAKRDLIASRMSPDSMRQGSIVIVIATDAPLLPHQLRLMAKRSMYGVSRTGSFGATHSGDFALAFSTYQAIPIENADLVPVHDVVPIGFLNPLFDAAIKAVYQAQINALAANQ